MASATQFWLGLSIAGPVTSVPSIALLRLLHSSRVSWRPLDILIVTLLVAQLTATLLTFCFSAATLLRSAGLLEKLLSGGIETPLCATLVGSWSAAQTLHATTLASVAVDRLLTIRWPYKYRLSVRKTQLRYHVVVLSIVSVLVGVATLFAGSNAVADDTCVFLPHLLDTRFAIFWACLHGALFLATLAATLAVAVTGIMIRCCGSDMIGSGSDLRTLGTTSDTSAASGTLTTQVARYGGSTPASSLTRPSSDTRNEPTRIEVSGRNRNRNLTVVAVLVVSYLTYHLPLLVLTILGSSFQWILPEWPFAPMILGLGLIQSILTMIALVSVDPFVQAWIKESLRPQSFKKQTILQRPNSLSNDNLTTQPSISTLKIDEERNFRIGLYSQDTTEVKFPLTNGSLFAHLVSPPAADGARVRRTSRLGICSLPSPTSADPPPCLSTFQSRPALIPRMEPLYSDPLPSIQTSFSEATTRGQFSEPIYASLSETLSSFRKTPNLNRTADFEDSATESAGEDFEFHNIRTSHQTLVSSSDEEDADSNPRFRSSGSANRKADSKQRIRLSRSADLVSSDSTPNKSRLAREEDADSKPRVRLNRSATYKVLCNVTCAPQDIPQISCSSNGVTCVTLDFPATQTESATESASNPHRSKLVTSLSMNDIDTVADDDLTIDNKPQFVPKFETKFQITSGSSGSTSALPVQRHFRRKSIDRPKLAHVTNFPHHISLEQQQNHVVSLDALHKALNESSRSFFDNGDIDSKNHEEKTVFVSEYL